MLRLSLCTFVLLVGLSTILAASHMKYRNIHRERTIRNHEQQRSLRHLLGKLIDTESNSIYTINGEKQQDIPIHVDIKPSTSVPSVHPSREQIACLAACHSCVEDYPIGIVSAHN
jgi:hypothetical protein